MAVTKGAMTSLPGSQTIFIQTAEEPENNSINFRDSLKFFQEQLVINGASFPSPSSSCRSGNDTLKRNGPRFCREQNADNNGRDLKDGDNFEGEIQSVRSCKIPIPTVDTILESVRVLRAIQKSQKERGSHWNLDITSQSDIESDFNLTSDWICVAEINQEAKNGNKFNLNPNSNTIGTDSSDTCKSIQVSEMKNKAQEDIVDLTAKDFATIESNMRKNSFWPSNTLNESILDNQHSSTFSVELLDKKAEFHVRSMNEENLKRDESLQTSIEESKEQITKIVQQADINTLQKSSELSDKSMLVADDIGSENCAKSDKTNNIQPLNTPDSLSKVCRDFLTYVNEKNSNPDNPKKEEPDSVIGMLEIETYEDIDTQKKDFLLNVTNWKEECSPNGSNSTKLENNDSDSGVGTQRSTSSLSPNIQHQMQKDSWSDTCSSQYASAECSPYHSLNSVFDSSMGLHPPALPREDEIAESPTCISACEWQQVSENYQENTTSCISDCEWQKVPENSHKSKPASDITEDQTSESQTPTESDKERHDPISEVHTDPHVDLCTPETGDIEQDTEGYYCFVSNYLLENPSLNKIQEQSKDIPSISETSDTLEKLPKTENSCKSDDCEIQTSYTNGTETTLSSSNHFIKGSAEEDVICDIDRLQKFTAASCDLISIVASLYSIKESPAFQVFPTDDEKFEETLCILSEGAFCEHPEDNYLVTIEDSTLHIRKDFQVLLSLSMKYGEVSVGLKNVLKVDNRMGRCVYIKCEFESLINLKTEIELHCLKHWQTDCLQLVHYPLKCHQNVVIIDLGSCSTRAGILMDQPTLPTIFFPTICATDKKTGVSVYGMEALQPEVRQHSNLSFPVRPSVKITKHTIDIDLLEGLFKKIFTELHVDPSDYTVQVCLPSNLSINAQNALVKLLLEGLKVKSVSLANQALLTLYAHDVSTAVVVNIGERTEVLPVVDGFIVENGVTKLPHGGQRLIHHMKHGLAEKRISLSNDIDSFVVQYIIENLAYVAEGYDKEMQIASQYPDLIKKTITLQPALNENVECKSISLEEARFKICEGLFNPELWGLDSPGIHHLVNKAIQATGIDVRKKIAENIYVSGGVTMLPGFVERLHKEVAKLSKAKIVPNVIASNYRYHCTYIGACNFARMKVFPQVCISLEEYNENNASALKKCALCF